LAKAKDDADKGLAVDPSNAVCNYVAGYVLAKQGKKSDALTYLNKADASAKSSGDTNLTNAVESLLKQVNGS
jgi:predicted Zn-dependent protease